MTRRTCFNFKLYVKEILTSRSSGVLTGTTRLTDPERWGVKGHIEMITEASGGTSSGNKRTGSFSERCQGGGAKRSSVTLFSRVRLSEGRGLNLSGLLM